MVQQDRDYNGSNIYKSESSFELLVIVYLAVLLLYDG
jgi:hypothetical protein